MKVQILIVLLAFVFSSLFSGRLYARKYYKPMPLHEALTVELNGVLKAANDMHTAFFEQNEERIEASVDQVLTFLTKARKKTSLAETQRPHLQKMIDSTSDELRQLKNSQGTDRTQSLKNAMEQLVLIAQTYKLDEYKIFFCPKDRAVWLQKSRKAKNPIHPKLYAECGKLVR